MMTKLVATLLTAMFCLAVCPVKAEHSNHASVKGINARQAKQHNRINAGVKNGQLTHVEANRLRAQQRHIARYENRSRNDGPGMTHLEKQRLDKIQNRQNNAIHQQKHDAQTH